MKNIALAVLLLSTVAAFPAQAITYYEDPIYKSLGPEDHHPMEDMIMLAEEGEVRAQYILGDLYAKGKGGFVKSEDKASDWFQMSARNGNAFSFIRLAALAKHNKDWTEAYQWYLLAEDHLGYGDDRKWAESQLKKLEDDKKVDEGDIKKATKAAQAWDDKSSDLLKADREMYKVKEAEHAEKLAKSLAAIPKSSAERAADAEKAQAEKEGKAE